MTTRRAPLALWATLLVVALAHVRAVAAPLLWDDRTLVPYVMKAPLRTLVSTPLADVLGAGNAYYRPVALVLLGIEARLFAGSPLALHAATIALHLGCVTLLFFLLRRRAAPPLAAFAAALWGLFPRLTEDVSLITGQMDVLAAAFGLAAIAYWRTEAPLRRVGASLLLFLALSSKEVGVAFAFAICVRAFLDRGWRRAPTALAPALAALAAWLASRAHVGLAWGAAVGSEGPAARVPRALEAVGRYALMLLDPLRPRVAIGARDVRDTSIVVFGAAVLVALALAAWARRRRLRDADVAEAVALVVCALVPVLQIVPLKLTPLVCDRFLYVPLAGIVLAATPAFDAWLAGSAQRRAASYAVATVGVVAFGVATSLRTADMASALRFWSVAIALERGDTLPVRNNVAAAFTEAHERRRARLVDEDTLRRNHDDKGLRRQRHRLVVNLVSTGEPRRAVEAARALTGDYPEDLDGWRSYAGAAMAAREFDLARIVAGRVEATFGGGVGAAMLQDVAAMEHAFESSTTTAMIARAHILRKIGADDEADATWLVVLSREDVPPARVADALQDLLEDGSFDAVDRAMSVARPRLGAAQASADVLVAARRAEREDADDAWRRVVASGKVEGAR